VLALNKYLIRPSLTRTLKKFFGYIGDGVFVSVNISHAAGDGILPKGRFDGSRDLIIIGRDTQFLKGGSFGQATGYISKMSDCCKGGCLLLQSVGDHNHLVRFGAQHTHYPIVSTDEIVTVNTSCKQFSSFHRFCVYCNDMDTSFREIAEAVSHHECGLGRVKRFYLVAEINNSDIRTSGDQFPFKRGNIIVIIDPIGSKRDNVHGFPVGIFLLEC